MSSSALTILMPIYNTRERLMYCLSSLENQSSYDFELIIHDNCSDDGSSELILDFINKNKSFMQIKYFKQKENLGASKNMLSLLNKLDSDFFLFLDSEDTITKNYISNLNAIIEKDNCDVYFPEFFELGINNAKRLMLAPTRISQAKNEFRLPLLISMTNLSGIGYVFYGVYRSIKFKNIFKKFLEFEANTPSKNMCLDISLAYYVALCADKIKIINDSQLFHYAKITVDSDRLRFNELGFENFIAVTPSYIFKEAVDILFKLNILPENIINHLLIILSKNEELIVLQRSLLSNIMEFKSNKNINVLNE
jgi:glycosyltransferase involved in cell wall biosynthesis